MVVFRFLDAILDERVRGQFLYMPTQEQQRENISTVYESYKLRNVIGGVDGCHIPFLEKPRQIPVGKTAKDFINRKGLTTINSQIVGGFDKRIYDILLSAPGSFHDGAVWGMSNARAWLETRFPQRILLGDSAYPQTDTLMTPYPEDESRYYK